MITIIIVSYGELHSLEKSINSILNQKIRDKYKIIVADPFPEAEELIYNKFGHLKEVEYFEDPSKGKSYALNLILKKIYTGNPNDIIISTDGDVFVNNITIKEIIEKFRDKSIGAVTGRPVSLNSRKNMVGYFSHLLLDAGAHKIRLLKSEKNQFIECSGYLFAFRNLIKEFPLDVAEDSIIPYLIWKKGYKVSYAEKAEVYVKFPTNLKEFITQKKRAGVGSHSKLNKYAKDFPKVKTLKNEIVYGTIWALSYPKNLKEIIWTISLFPIRLYIWLSYYYDVIFRKKEYVDGWRLDIKKSKILD